MRIENLHDRVRESADFILCQKAGIGPVYMGKSDICKISEKDAEQLFKKLSAAAPVPVLLDGRLKKCLGYCNFTENRRTGERTPKLIKIAKIQSSWAERVKTLAHEMAHAILHGSTVWPGRPDYGSVKTLGISEKEFEADLSAFIVADVLGITQALETMSYVFGTFNVTPNGMNIMRSEWAAAEILKRI